MRRNVLFLTFFFIFSPYGFAHPPGEIKLSYNMSNQQLHIEAAHVSRDKNQHYIRKIEMRKNNTETATKRYHQQVTPSTFTKDIALIAEEGDTIEVILYCSEGGNNSVMLEVRGKPLQGKTPESDALKSKSPSLKMKPSYQTGY